MSTSDTSGSRPSTSDGQQRPSAIAQGPIPLFDTHLRVLAESYLGFFQERKKIEEVYVESLQKLHRKAKTLDVYLDHGNELTTTRRAWGEVRDNVEREVQTRQAFLAAFATDVITPLQALRDTQDRTRKRIKEDLKEAVTAHSEYADNTLPKLKRHYLRKCQEVEDLKATAISPTQSSSSTENDNDPVYYSTPPVTSPQLRPLGRRPSGHQSTARNRSPSSSTALSDLAHQGKRQLNQLMTFLDKSNTVKDGMGGVRTDNALRIVRAKREADDADKEYRKGIHWLETLRLRRMKTLEAGYKSLEMFILESAESVKLALEKYMDNMTATTTTESQLSSHVRDIVVRIAPEQDTSGLAPRISRSLASSIPSPVLYYNYHVGECNDLIFGVSLVDYATARGLGEGEIPRVIRLCIREIDVRGLEAEGIYRVSGRHSVLQELRYKIEKNERTFKFNPINDDVFVVGSLLKMYLRELPEPLFRIPLAERIQHSEDYDDHKLSKFALLRGKIRRLPAVHQATLKAVVEHLARVAERPENKMDTKNLAIVFGSVIFGEDEMAKGADLLSVQNHKDSLMEDMIANAYALFDEHSAAGSPVDAPLPSTPAGEPPVFYPYGSAHTKVASIPATSQQALNDFSPDLPNCPPNSIHPSSRINRSPSWEEIPAGPPPLPSRPRSGENQGRPLSPLNPEFGAVASLDQLTSDYNPYAEAVAEANANRKSAGSPDTFSSAVSSHASDAHSTTRSAP